MDASQYATAAHHLMAVKMYSLASCVMLFYDMLLTFGDEIDKIWKQSFTGATILWFLNRYLTPLGYIIITVSFHDPDWGPSACNRYVRFPEILKLFSASAVGAIFILRLYAVYWRNKWIFVTFTTLLIVELAVKIYSFTGGVRLHLPEGLVGCILTGQPHSTLQLYSSMHTGRMSSIVRVMLRDGVVYFAVIFVSNLVTVLIYVAAAPDLKVLNASFSTLITTLMVSRLMLNLRQHDDESIECSVSMPFFMSTPTFPKGQGRTRMMCGQMISQSSDLIPMTFVGNLGEPRGNWEQQDERKSKTG